MRQVILVMIKYLMIPFGVIYSLFKRKSKLLILMYHRVNDNISKELSVLCDNFEWQMEYLHKNGYKVISLDEAVKPDWIKSTNEKEKYVVLTFDDGYEDFCSNAFPILKRYNYPSIIYLVPGYIETGKTFWWDKDIGQSSLLSWESIIELRDSGIVSIGSHSMSHRDFNKIEKEEIFIEMAQSKKILQEKLSSDIKHFSYPRGIVTQSAMETARIVYETAVSIFDGYEIIDCFKDETLVKLKRLPAQRSDGRFLFSARLRGWLILEEWIKRFMIKY